MVPHGSQIFWVSSSGLGEIIFQTPAMKSLSDAGARIYLVCPFHYAVAFETIPFIEKVVPLVSSFDPEVEPEMHYALMADYPFSETRLSEQAVNKMRQLCDGTPIFYFAGNCSEATEKLLNSYFDKPVFLNALCPKYECGKYGFGAIYGWAEWAGVPLRDPKLAVGFKRCPVSIAPSDKKRVGLCVGSQENGRRLHMGASSSLVEFLSKDYEVFLFGMDDDNYRLSVADNLYHNLMTRSFSRESLRQTLSYLEKMDVLIAPDIGLFVCALALGIPIVCLENFTLMETLIPDEYFDMTRTYSCADDRLSCNRDCQAKYVSLHPNFSKLSRPIPNKTWGPFVQRMGLDARRDLDCLNLQQRSVPCLTNIDPSKVGELVADLIAGRTPTPVQRGSTTATLKT